MTYTIVEPHFEFIPPPEAGKELEFLEICTRNCYKSEDKICPGSAEKLLNKVIKEYEHLSVVEHAQIILEFLNISLIELQSIYEAVPLFAFRTTEGRFHKGNRLSTFLSGNIRMWMELIKNLQFKYNHIDLHQAIQSTLHKKHSFFFSPSNNDLCKIEINIIDENPLTNKDNLTKKQMHTHMTLTGKFIGDRGMSHQLVRHRLAAYSQESQRYCVAGNMELGFKNPHRRQTIKEFYNTCFQNQNSSWQRVNIKQVNEDTGIIQYAKIKNIFSLGKKETCKITTRLGYQIVSTLDHKILTPNGYKIAEQLQPGTYIAINGTDRLYRSYDWFKYQYEHGKNTTDIARICNIAPSTARKWQRIHGIESDSLYKQRTPWNKNLCESEDIRIQSQANALREYHWNQGRTKVAKKNRISKLSKSTYTKIKKDKCEICGSDKRLQVHHIDGCRNHNNLDNLLTCCPRCHSGIHNKNLHVIHYDEVISFDHCGLVEVFDIEMDSKFHNFIANGIVVHNCNYGKKGFQFIIPPSIREAAEKHGHFVLDTYMRSALDDYDRYQFFLECGVPPEDARRILPNCTKTEVVATMTLGMWKHIIEHRGHNKKAEWQIKEICLDAERQFHTVLPEIF